MVRKVVLLGLKIALGQELETKDWERSIRADLPGKHWSRNTYAVIATGPGLDKLLGVLAWPTVDVGTGVKTWVMPDLARAQSIFRVIYDTDKTSCWLFFREGS